MCRLCAVGKKIRRKDVEKKLSNKVASLGKKEKNNPEDIKEMMKKG